MLVSVESFHVSQDVLRGTLAAVREWAPTGKERFVFWLGEERGRSVEIKDIMVPRQQSFVSRLGAWVDISAQEIRHVDMEAIDRGLVVAGQVHTHPGEAFHSPRDDARSDHMPDGSLSIVIPYLARVEFTDFGAYAVHRKVADGVWHLLDVAEARRIVVAQVA